MVLDNSKQESGLDEELEQEEVALSSSELDNIINSAEIRNEDGDTDDDNLEQYGVWVKVEPEKIEASADEIPFELADLEVSGETELTDEEEELLGELESDLEPRLGEEESPELEGPEELTPEDVSLTELEEIGMEGGSEEAEEIEFSAEGEEVESLPDLESELELLAEEEDLALPGADDELEEDELDLPLSEDTTLDEPLEELDAFETGAAAPAVREESAAILRKIELELQSIKDEIHSLKKDLSTMSQANQSGDLRLAPAPAGGFFAEEEDETIALTGDELDNILNTADITEEKAEVAKAAETELSTEPLPPEDEIEINIPAMEEDVFTPAPAGMIEEAGELEDLDTLEEESPELEELSLEEAGLAEELDVEELDGEELGGGELDVEELGGEELDVEDLDVEDLDVEELGGEDLDVEDLDVEELDAEEETALPAEPSELRELELPDLELEAGEEALMMEEAETSEEIPELTMETEEEAPVLDDLQLEEISEAPAAAEAPDMEIEELEELSAAEDMEEVSTAGDMGEASLGEDLEELGELEELDREPQLDTEAEELESLTEEDLPLMESVGEPAADVDATIPVELRPDIKSVLSYLDQLLESLPEEKIREFANSEYFGVYKKLFEDLGLEG
jgi:pilus assembly protein FimV